MNILLLCRKYYPSFGGIETSVFQLAKSFSKMGHRTVILTASPRPTIPRVEYSNIIYIEPPSRWQAIFPKLYLATFGKNLKKIYNTIGRDIDLIIGRDTFMTNIAYDFDNKKSIVYIPSMDVKRFLYTRERKNKSFKDIVLKFLEDWQYAYEIKNQQYAINNIPNIIVFCKGMKGQLEDSYGEKTNRIEVCYPGCSLEYTDKNNDKKNDDFLNLLYIGRFSPEKNLMMLLEAVSILQEKIRLVLVGDGIGMEELKTRTSTMPPNIIVSFEGMHYDVAKYYQNADYFIFPSKYESFGQVIIESFTFGVPVIGFSSIHGKTSTAIEELVVDDVTGIICREFSVEALSKSIKRACINHNNLVKQCTMSCACISFAKKYFNWDNLAQTCIRLAKHD